MSDANIVLSAFGFLFIVTTLLGLSGLTGTTLIIPGPPEEVSEDNPQGIGSQFVECIITFYTDCDRDTESSFFAAVANTVDFAVAYLAFFFQLITFQLPKIPTWLNAIIVVPPAVALAFIGIKLVRGAGS